MTCGSQHAWLLAVVTLLAILAPSLGGEWCENFETGAGMFWSQRSYSGQWQHTTYTEESKSGDGKMPKPTTGEGKVTSLIWSIDQSVTGKVVADWLTLLITLYTYFKKHDKLKRFLPAQTRDGMLLLRPSLGVDSASSRLVSPELVFSDGASIELTYWLQYTDSHSQVNFLLFRLVNGVEDKEPFLNITSYSTKHDSHWSTLQAGLNLDKGKKIRVAIYGYLDGNAAVNIGLDRVILRGVNDNNACGETRPMPPTSDPGPEGPNFDFFCPTALGLYMDPESCAFFYSCSSWMAIHMPCYTGLVFNPKNSMCDYLSVVPSCQ